MKAGRTITSAIIDSNPQTQNFNRVFTIDEIHVVTRKIIELVIKDQEEIDEFNKLLAWGRELQGFMVNGSSLTCGYSEQEMKGHFSDDFHTINGKCSLYLQRLDTLLKNLGFVADIYIIPNSIVWANELYVTINRSLYLDSIFLGHLCNLIKLDLIEKSVFWSTEPIKADQVMQSNYLILDLHELKSKLLKLAQ